MKKPDDIIWHLPFFFFIFLSIFISFKFLFIFFFRAAFEPGFIFELTPFYIFSGVNNLQLLFLSSFVVVYDTYLHIKSTRENLLRSIIPTGIMLSGLGLGVITKEISVSNLPSYLLFGLLLMTVLIDHRRTLIHAETLPSKPPAEPRPSLQKLKIPFFTKPKLKKPLKTGKPKPSFIATSSLFSIFKRGKKTGKPVKKDKAPDQPKPTSPTAKETKEEAVQLDETPASKPPEEIVFKEKPQLEGEKEAPSLKGKPAKPSQIVEGQVGKAGVGLEEKTPLGKVKRSEEQKIDMGTEVLKDFEKKKDILKEEIRKPIVPIPKKEMETLREELEDRQREIKYKTTVIQEVRSDFENIQGGLESLKNELENICAELQSTVQKSETSETKPEVRRFEGTALKETRPSPFVSFPRRTSEERIRKPTPDSLTWKMHEKRKLDLLRAQTILGKLEKKVEKLEQIYIK